MQTFNKIKYSLTMNPTRQFGRIGTQSRVEWTVNIFSDIMRLLQSHVLGDLFKNIIFLFNKLLIVSDGLEENN